MTSKAAWASSLQGFKKATSKKGRVPPPVKVVINSMPESLVVNTDSAKEEDCQVVLLKAAISSQKATIAAFQEDLVHSYGKMAKAKTELKKCKAKLAKQSNYQQLKEVCEGGYAVGFDAGQIKVGCKCAALHICYRDRCLTHGKTNLPLSLVPPSNQD